jgi:hypothetical protein
LIISQEYIASLFRIEEQAKKETTIEQAAIREGFLHVSPIDPEYERGMFQRNVS